MSSARMTSADHKAMVVPWPVCAAALRHLAEHTLHMERLGNLELLGLFHFFRKGEN